MKPRLKEDPSYIQYHLNLSREMARGARAAIIPGAPERAELIAAGLRNATRVASHRGLDTWVGDLGTHPVLVTNTGMGGPTLEIVVQELIQLGVDTFLRLGTTGAIRPDIPTGSLIVTEAAIRLDGTSDHYAPPCYPAAASIDMVVALHKTAKARGVPVHSGLTISSATFYPGQERYDSASGYVQRHFQGSLKEWQSLEALNYEMEAGALFTICRTMGLRAGCLCVAVANRTESEAVHRDIIRRGEEQVAAVGLDALSLILNETPLW